MKSNFLFSVLLILIISSCKDRGISPKPTTDGLISYYKFKGNSSDSFGSNDGLNTNADVSESVAEFNGSTSYIDLPIPFDLENKTISFWFLAKEIPVAGSRLFTSDNADLTHGLSVFTVRLDGEVQNLYFNYSNGIASVPIEKNAWYHLAATLEGKSYRYYLNGVLISSGSFVDYYKSGNGVTSTVIGASRIHDYIFTGSIDDLRIYERALSEKEIDVLAKR